MASISKQTNGGKIVQFVDEDGRRQTIRLGKAAMEWAREVKRHVEVLLAAKVQKTTPERPTLEWVAQRDKKLRKRLYTVGLIELPAEEKEAVEEAAKPRLGGFLVAYIERRVDTKPATREVWGQVQRNLLAFFGEDRDISTITEGDAEDFKLFLIGEGLAATTVAKRLQFARQFFRDAVKRKIVQSNPFAEVRGKASSGSDRQRFVPRADIDRLLEASLTLDWRIIISLCRYGGLRCPSEVLSLRLDAIDWARDRILVHSPKTEHHAGKASREIPLFPELRAVLLEAAEAAPDGAEYVVGGGYRDAANSPSGWRNCNLRTQFERIVRRAGLEPWPRLFHNLRASRETELVAEHPVHVVTAWLGNTPKIAQKHYLMVMESDFQKALQNPKQLVTKALQKAKHQDETPSNTESQETTQAPEDQGLVLSGVLPCDTVGQSSAERTGLSPLAFRNSLRALVLRRKS